MIVEDAMRADGAIVATPNELAANVARRASELNGRPVIVRARVGEWRLMDAEELARLAADAPAAHKIGEGVSKGPLPIIFPDEPLEEVLRWVGDWAVLPVVSRADATKLEAVLTLEDILRAFRNTPGGV